MAGPPTIKSLNGAAGTVIRNDTGEAVQDPNTRTNQQTGADRQNADAVEGSRQSNTGVPLEARVAILERQLAAERAAREAERDQRIALENRVNADREADLQAKRDATAAQREEGWLKKGLMDILMLFLRMFFPIISLISLVVRVLRIAYKVLIKKEKMTADDWKREGMLFLADLAGAAPMVGILAGPVGFLGGAALGGVISSGIHAAVKVTSEDKDDMLGWEKQEPSGLRIGWEKLRELGSETYAAVTGQERPSETRAIEQSNIDTRTVTPSDIPVT